MSRNDSISSLVKAISILKSYSPGVLELGVKDISNKLNIPTSTAHRLLATMYREGLLDKDEKKGRYRIGHTLYGLGSLYLQSTDLIVKAEPILKMLNELTREAVNMGILEKENLVIVLKEETRGAVRFSTHVGTVVQAHSSGMGKALLSQLTEEEIDKLFPREELMIRTPNTIRTKTLLKEELRTIRETGVSYSRQEGFNGIEAIASFIIDATGKAIAAMSIAVPVFRMDDELRIDITSLIKMACRLLSFRLGYRDDSHVDNEKDIRLWWLKTYPDGQSREE